MPWALSECKNLHWRDHRLCCSDLCLKSVDYLEILKKFGKCSTIYHWEILLFESSPRQIVGGQIWHRVFWNWLSFWTLVCFFLIPYSRRRQHWMKRKWISGKMRWILMRCLLPAALTPVSSISKYINLSTLGLTQWCMLGLFTKYKVTCKSKLLSIKNASSFDKTIPCFTMIMV